MITTEGKTHVKRYLAGFVPSIAQSIAFGIGPKAEAVGDTKLQFEVGRADISLTSYDFVNNKLIFKAPVDETFGGKIYEVALFSTPANAAAGEFGSKVITTFDSASEEWLDTTAGTAPNFQAVNARVGADALRQQPALSTTKSDSLTDISLDLSGYSAADKFVLACFVSTAFMSNVKIRFLTDASNHYEISTGAQTAGYKVLEMTKGSAVATGTPDWGNITEIRVSTTATSGGMPYVDFDGLRIEDADTVNSDYVMVSRELLSAFFTKQEGMTQEIEFALDVNV